MVEPPTPYIDEDERQQDTQAPSSPTPVVIIESNEVDEEVDEMPVDHSSPPRAGIEVDEVELTEDIVVVDDDEDLAEVEVKDETEVEMEVEQLSSPFEDLSQPRSPSPPAEDDDTVLYHNPHILSPINEETPSELALFSSPLKKNAPSANCTPAQISYSSYHSLFTHLHNLLAHNRIDEAREVVAYERKVHKFQPASSLAQRRRRR